MTILKADLGGKYLEILNSMRVTAAAESRKLREESHALCTQYRKQITECVLAMYGGTVEQIYSETNYTIALIPGVKISVDIKVLDDSVPAKRVFNALNNEHAKVRAASRRNCNLSNYTQAKYIAGFRTYVNALLGNYKQYARTDKIHEAAVSYIESLLQKEKSC